MLADKQEFDFEKSFEEISNLHNRIVDYAIENDNVKTKSLCDILEVVDKNEAL